MTREDPRHGIFHHIFQLIERFSETRKLSLGIRAKKLQNVYSYLIKKLFLYVLSSQKKTTQDIYDRNQENTTSDAHGRKGGQN